MNAMTQVNATIAGRQFRLACEDGQQDHLHALANDMDTRIEDAAPEVRRDRRHAADRDGGADGGGRARRGQAPHPPAGGGDRRACRTRAWWRPTAPRPASAAVVGAFNSAAERIEGITRKLNATVRNGNGAAIG